MWHSEVLFLAACPGANAFVFIVSYLFGVTLQDFHSGLWTVQGQLQLRARDTLVRIRKCWTLDILQPELKIKSIWEREETATPNHLSRTSLKHVAFYPYKLFIKEWRHRCWSHAPRSSHMVVEEAVLGPACYFSPSVQWVPGFLLWSTAIKRCKPQHITEHILPCSALNSTGAGHGAVFLLSKMMLSFQGRA